MGREATCVVRIGRATDETKVLLESGEIVIRGSLRRRIAWAALGGLAVDSEALVFSTDDGPVRLELGAREAAKWLAAIQNPKSVVDKLGLEAGQKIAIVGALEPGLLEQVTAKVGTLAGARAGELDALLMVLSSTADFARIEPAVRRLAPAGALWTVRRKGPDGVPEAAVRAAGLAAGLVDVKVVALSPTLTAEKFVRPRHRR